MQTKVAFTLALGFLLGLGLASCSSVESNRSVASDGTHRYGTANGEQRDEKVACNVGEERNENGDCVRPFNFDRPFHRGGR